MIQAVNVTKKFDGITAVDSISAEMREGCVFGLVGSNGAGKSTFMRMLAGVLRPDTGNITVDGQPVWENPRVKQRCFFIPDELYFFKNSTLKMLCDYYINVYPKFDKARFGKLCGVFELDPKRKISTFSKGMKRQSAIICALSSGCEYIFFDETFDGLDPTARQAVKSLLINEMGARELTPVVASHNLRELEDLCDHVGLLHKGGILFSKDLEDMKLGIHKLQCAFTVPKTRGDFESLDILSFETRGALCTMTVRGDESEIMRAVSEKLPVFAELIPLSLEEIFITETEVMGYNLKELLF